MNKLSNELNKLNTTIETKSKIVMVNLLTCSMKMSVDERLVNDKVKTILVNEHNVKENGTVTRDPTDKQTRMNCSRKMSSDTSATA